MLELVEVTLITSNLQFGFKKKLGCSHAIYAMQTVVEYYTCLLYTSDAADE